MLWDLRCSLLGALREASTTSPNLERASERPVVENRQMDPSIEAVPLLALSSADAAYWDACIRENPLLTPFHSRDWLTAWAASYEETSQSLVVVYRDADGLASGVLPMMRWRGELRSLSYNATDYTGLIWLGNARPPAVALSRWLRSKATQTTVRLWNVRPGDPLVNVLASRQSVELVERNAASAIRLTDAKLRPWKQVRRTSARDLERRRRRLADAGMRIWYGSRIDHATLGELVAVHTRRWEAVGERGNFSDPRRVSFIRRLLDSELRLFFAVMYVQGRIVSYRFGPIDAGTYYDWNTGTAPEDGALKRLSPGLVLLDETVGRLFLSERVRRVDFLRGGEDYKRAWQTEDTWVSEYRVLSGVDAEERVE